jgi:hypothetical protein
VVAADVPYVWARIDATPFQYVLLMVVRLPVMVVDGASRTHIPMPDWLNSLCQNVQT